MKKIAILLVDDHPVFRKALRNIIDEQDDMEVKGEASNGIEAVELAFQLFPDVILMDISMPEMNGLEATRKIKAKHPEIMVLVLTIHDDIEHIFSILEAGGDGYLTKSVIDKEIIFAIQ